MATNQDIFERLLDQLRSSDDLIGHLERCSSGAMKFESPIERMLGTAFVALCALRDLRVRQTHGATLCSLQRFDGRHDVAISSQVRVGNMRCDFGLVVWYGGQVIKTVVVECDGHEFHERTKEQAQKDKARDREIQRQGYSVLRFTGSEIWRNAFLCAAELCSVVDGEIFGAMFMETISKASGGAAHV